MFAMFLQRKTLIIYYLKSKKQDKNTLPLISKINSIYIIQSETRTITKRFVDRLLI